MALVNVGDLQNEVLVRNNRTTTDSFITDGMLQDWTRMAHSWASAAHKWPFTEGRVSTTWAGTEELNFEGYKADSFRMILVGGKRMKKLNFRDYQIYREEEPNGDERVYSDYGKLVYVNPRADLSGTLTAYGQYQPTLDPTDLTAETVFSSWDVEGNEAVVERMMAYQKTRERQLDEATMHEQKAKAILDEIWQRVLEEQHVYQGHADSGGMFERIDVMNGGMSDDLFNRDQF